jgi:hypothetical protein
MARHVGKWYCDAGWLNIFPALKGRDFHHWRPMFEPGNQQMPISLFTAGDFTLADSGNCAGRFNGSSCDGLLAGGDSRNVAETRTRINGSQVCSVVPLNRTLPQRLLLIKAAPPRRQRRCFRRGDCR